MTKYILCFLCGVAVCLIFICFMQNKIAINPITTTISVDTISIDTIYIERGICPVSFTGVGILDATKSPVPVKTDTIGRIVIVDNISNNEILKQVQDNIKNNCSDEISSLDKYILPEFIVCFDTVINRDTFNLRYEFPINLFTFDFLPHRDSIMFQQITIEHTKIQTKQNWFTTLAISTGTGLIGYFIGRKN